MGQLITGAGFTGTIGGNITVYGTAERQTITVADVPGTVTFDPSFNKGGDTIVLGKSAGSFTIAQSGSTVVLTSGDRKVIIPVGVAANTIQFADGDRTLIYDNGFKLGGQTVTTTAAAISAAGTSKSTLAADASTFTARLVLSAENASVGGNLSVYGSSAAETVSLVGGGNITFDPSFNKGGDTISFAKSAPNYSAQRSGSSILIKEGASTISIPVGTVGLTADFNGDRRNVVFSNGDFKIGEDKITDLSVLTPVKVAAVQFSSATRIEGISIEVPYTKTSAGQYVFATGFGEIYYANGILSVLPGFWSFNAVNADYQQIGKNISVYQYEWAYKLNGTNATRIEPTAKVSFPVNTTIIQDFNG